MGESFEADTRTAFKEEEEENKRENSVKVQSTTWGSASRQLNRQLLKREGKIYRRRMSGRSINEFKVQGGVSTQSEFTKPHLAQTNRIRDNSLGLGTERVISHQAANKLYSNLKESHKMLS